MVNRKSSKGSSSKRSTDRANANRVKKAVKKYDSSKSARENSQAIGGIVQATATSAARSKSSGKRKFYTVLCIIVILAVAALLVYGYYNHWFDSLFSPKNPPTVDGELSVHFLELGNKYTGDCVYIKAGETDVLIDAGSKNDSAPTIISYLDNYVTDGKLEYVIATHAHEDHIAGFYDTTNREGVFSHFETGTIIDFALSPKTANGKVPSSGTVLGKYLKALQLEVDAGAVHYTAAQCFNQEEGAQRVYQLADNISLEILYNYYYFNYDSGTGENNYSVCCLIKQGDNNYFFSGDLEEKGEKKLVEYYQENSNPLPHCVLYKAGHHGSKTSTSTALMDAITPEYCCVCCCCGTSEYTDTNANQFPTQEFVDRIAPHTDKVYVTTMVDNYVSGDDWRNEGTVKSMNGNIVFSCDNGTISIVCSNNDLLLKDTEWFKNNRTCPDAWK